MESEMQYLGAISKMTEWYWFLDRQTIQHHSNPSLCPNHWGQWRWSWPVLWRPVRPSRTTHTHTQMSFLSLGMECQSRKSRDTWRNRQVWPWSTKWSRTKANRALPRECTGHSKHPLPTTHRRLYTRTSPDGQHRNQIDYILCSHRWGSSIQSAKTRPGADCGSDHELLIAQFRLKL